MKKSFIILFAILFSTSLLAHEPPNFNSKDNCRKKLSMLEGISKLKGYGGGEIIKFNSYTWHILLHVWCPHVAMLIYIILIYNISNYDSATIYVL